MALSFPPQIHPNGDRQMFGLFKRRKAKVEVETPSYSEVIGTFADSSGKHETDIHYHIYKWCVDNGLIHRDRSDPYQTSVNLMRRAYQDHRDAVTAELDRYCAPPDTEAADAEKAESPVEEYPLPPGHVALKDPRFNLLCAYPESRVLFARQINESGFNWFVDNAVEFGKETGLSPASIEQCRLATETWPRGSYYVSRCNPQDLDLPAPPVDPEPTLEPEPAKPLTERQRLIQERQEKGLRKRTLDAAHRIIVIDKSGFGGGFPVIPLDVHEDGSKTPSVEFMTFWRTAVIHGESWMVELPEVNRYCFADHPSHIALETFAPLTLSD